MIFKVVLEFGEAVAEMWRVSGIVPDSTDNEVRKIPGGVCLNLKGFYSAFRQRKPALIFFGSRRRILVQK